LPLNFRCGISKSAGGSDRKWKGVAGIGLFCYLKTIYIESVVLHSFLGILKFVLMHGIAGFGSGDPGGNCPHVFRITP
jgi:hypothetical protein